MSSHKGNAAYRGEKRALRLALETISGLATFDGMIHEDKQKLELAVRIGRIAKIADTALRFRHLHDGNA